MGKKYNKLADVFPSSFQGTSLETNLFIRTGNVIKTVIDIL